MMTEASVRGLYVQENMALFMLFEASTATQSEDNGKFSLWSKQLWFVVLNVAVTFVLLYL